MNYRTLLLMLIYAIDYKDHVTAKAVTNTIQSLLDFYPIDKKDSDAIMALRSFRAEWMANE